MSKKILLITQNFYPEIGSAANRMKNMYHVLSEKQTVHVMTTTPTYPNQEMYQDSRFWDDRLIHIKRVSICTKNYTSNLFLRFVLYMETVLKLVGCVIGSKESYDRIIVSTPPIFIAMVGIVAKKKWKIPLILDVRDLWPESLLGIGRMTNKWLLKMAYYLEKRIYRASDRIIINSEAYKTYLVELGVDERQIHFIPNSLTVEELKSQPRADEEEPMTVIYTGNIGLAQNLDIFIKLAQELHGNKQIRFKIVGYGYKRSILQQKVAEANLKDTTVVLPPHPRADVFNMTKKADVAFLSLEEHPVFQKVMPGKLIDYMGCGLPIVGIISGYAQSIISEANCGYAYKEKEVGQLVSMLITLSESEELRQELGKNGHRYAKNHFNWEQNKAKLREVCEL